MQRTLEGKVWSVKTGSAMQSVPVTYVINGEQYVLTPVGLGGGYRLFGKASDMSTLETKSNADHSTPAGVQSLAARRLMPVIQTDIPSVPKPPEQPGSVQQIAEGARVYNKFFCQKCHSPPEADGSGAWVHNGEVPDLRFTCRAMFINNSTRLY